MDGLVKQQGTSPKQHQAIRIISSSHVTSNWSYSPETVKLCCDLSDLDLWPMTLTFCMDFTLVLGDNSWRFHDDTMIGTLSKRCDEQTDGQTDRQTDRQTDGQTENTIQRAAWSLLKIYQTLQSKETFPPCAALCRESREWTDHDLQRWRVQVFTQYYWAKLYVLLVTIHLAYLQTLSMPYLCSPHRKWDLYGPAGCPSESNIAQTESAHQLDTLE